MAAKDSWSDTLFTANGLTARIRNSAKDSAVGGSLSRRKIGAISSMVSMTQARTTEGVSPTVSA